MTTITTEAIPYHTRNGTWRRGWAKKFRIFRLYIYISNCKMKKRPKRDLMYSGFTQDHCIENKHKLYDRQGGYVRIAGSPSTTRRWSCTTSCHWPAFLNSGRASVTASCSAIAATKRYIVILT